MFNKHFAHYISYGSTDQLTLRELSDTYDGLLVPATVAAFQRDGTGGFVLSLSASQANTDYVIDSRFPLFQQGIANPKKSHTALANIFDDESLLSSQNPKPEKFTDELLKRIAKNWKNFNLKYQEEAKSKFDKYAQRLGEEVRHQNSKCPLLILAPYFICESPKDAWWDLSKKLFDFTCGEVGDNLPTRRVIATETPQALNDLLSDVTDAECTIWVSGLHEINNDSYTLSEYLNAIHKAKDDGKKLFALYGGFFSVLASSCGLHGSSHGIGFGEHRSWLELPQSGPPPQRYYLPTLHRYVRPEDAFILWKADKALVGCNCPECTNKQSPIELEYHELMKHSAYCRHNEINDWSGLTCGEAMEKLSADYESFCNRLENSSVPEWAKSNIILKTRHIPVWVKALELHRQQFK